MTLLPPLLLGPHQDASRAVLLLSSSAVALLSFLLRETSGARVPPWLDRSFAWFWGDDVDEAVGEDLEELDVEQGDDAVDQAGVDVEVSEGG